MSRTKKALDPAAEFFSTGEVAKLTGVCRRTVSGWFKGGTLAVRGKPTGHYRIPRATLVAFMRDNNMPLGPLDGAL